MISKLFVAIQTLTYSCCSEELECKRQAATPNTTESELKTKFGISGLACDGNLLILPNKPSISGRQKDLFQGKIGRLRHFALPVMIAAGPLSREIVHLALSFPDELDHLNHPYARAPIVFPILCGHVLTHVVSAMCASCGRSGTSESALVTESHYIEDCKSFIQLGYIARVLQVSLGLLQQRFHSSPLEWNKYEAQILGSISVLVQMEADSLTKWEIACCHLLRIALEVHVVPGNVDDTVFDAEINPDLILSSIRAAKKAVYGFLCSACLILQVLAPTFVLTIDHIEGKSEEDTLCETMNIDVDGMLNSSLARQVVKHWYGSSRPRLEFSALKRRLNCSFKFKAFDWPCVFYNKNELEKKSKSPLPTVPLLQGSVTMGKAKDDKPRIKALPVSYTDLYAELNRISPNFESTALCLICGEVSDINSRLNCGHVYVLHVVLLPSFLKNIHFCCLDQVLNADGKAECTTHALDCGGGCGILFLLQKCSVLIIHREKPIIIPSPYVDRHGETPHYRGRPLFIDMSRYENLHELWSSHLTREKVIYERSTAQPYRLFEIDNSNY